MDLASNSALQQIAVVVVGGLATDIFVEGLDDLHAKKQPELKTGGTLCVGAGGKSRNIAEMIACLLGRDRVAMVGRTSQDPAGLWRIPIDALNKVGVDTQFVEVLSFEEAGGQYPQIAIIRVNKQGKNQIHVFPGINKDLPAELVKAALPAFHAAAQNKGFLALSLELSADAALASIAQARQCGLKVLLDPGGIDDDSTPLAFIDALLECEICLIKPNHDEARMLTGITVTDFLTARLAAAKLLSRRIDFVLITHGKNGAYLFGGNGLGLHLENPNYPGGPHTVETGCGDQVMAALCYGLQSGMTVKEAACLAILAGTMQFYRPGIVPVTKAELLAAQEALKG